jgi:hypothetical protein
MLLVREESIQMARRATAYLKQSGAATTNMSWGRPLRSDREFAGRLPRIYAKAGKNPDTVKTLPPQGGLDLIQRLDVEVRVADAARLALAFYENPDVLFVIAAGNDAIDNDDELPVPQYLSRFFPNVLSVASCDGANALSRFSNYGATSVSLAAPGEKVESTILAHLTAQLSGTSMAAPYVSGLAARIRVANDKMSARDLKELLEGTVTRLEPLKERLTSGGVVNPEAAVAAAPDWSAKRLERLARSGADYVATSHHTDGPLVFDIRQLQTAATDRGGWRITAAGGFTHSWRVVMSKGTRFLDQMHNGVDELDGDGIAARWKEGWRITSLAGDDSGWNNVMSKGGKGRQRMIQLEKAVIAQAAKEGLRITALGGFKEQWRVAATFDTGWGEQQVSEPSAYDAQRKQWIANLWKTGYRITSLAGDDVEDDDNDGWLWVMTKGTGWGKQVCSEQAPWPDAWIEQHYKQGYRITGFSGFQDRWIVVMTQGTPYTEQVISPPEPGFPATWIKAHW